MNEGDRESDLSDCYLSEGSAALPPLIIMKLETNMNNIKLGKKLITQDNPLKDKKFYCTISNSKCFNKKSSSFDQEKSHNSKVSKLSNESNNKVSSTLEESMKISSSRQCHRTLKDEIKYLLRKLANERLFNSEWKSSNLQYINEEEKKASLFDSEIINTPHQNISKSLNKIQKVVRSDSINSSEDISMRHIRPNWDLDYLFN